MSAAFQWTDAWTAHLIDLRKRGFSHLECAAELGVSALVIEKKCRELGLNKRMNRGRISGRKALNQGAEQ